MGDLSDKMSEQDGVMSHAWTQGMGAAARAPKGTSDMKILAGALEENSDSDAHMIAAAFVEAGATCVRKNRDYGSSVFQAPVMDPEMNPGDAIKVRMSDKIARIATLEKANANAPEVDESLIDTYMDLGAYAILRVIQLKREK